MQRALAAKPLPLPEPITTAPRELARDMAALTPSFERGALLLAAADGRRFRLSWEEGAGADRRRALPAGAYTLVGYRIVAADAGGRLWHVSASGAKLRELDLPAGTERTLAIDPTIRIMKRVAGGELQVTVQGDDKAGLTIYREGKRIPLGFELSGADGARRGAGQVRYG